MVDIKPLHDLVLIKRMPEEEKSRGGIYIPETAQGSGPLKRGRGHVIAIGPGRKSSKSGERIPIDGLALGDEVIFDRLVGDDVTMPDLDDDHVLVQATDLTLVVIEEKK